MSRRRLSKNLKTGSLGYKSFPKARFADHASKAFEMFPACQAKDVASATDKFLTVASNGRRARLVAQSMERKKSKAYLYQFTRLPDTAMTRKPGVHHGMELACVFGNMKITDGYDNPGIGLPDAMMDYWVNFAKTCNLNGPGLVDWPAYKRKSDLNLEFSDAIHTNQHLFKKECDFISKQSQYD
jgi:para-nitrobenzyl esterase